MSPYVNEDYRDILRAFFATKKARSGLKTNFAEKLSVKSSYLSQVLAKKAHLTPDQVFQACDFFEWNEEETEYMLLCSQKDRCKDTDLKNFYLKQIKKLKNNRQSKGQPSFVPNEFASQKYYNDWLTPVVHKWILENAPAQQETIFQCLSQPRSAIDFSLKTLSDLGLVYIEKNKLKAKNVTVSLPKGKSLQKKYLNESRANSLLNFPDASQQRSTNILSGKSLNSENLQQIFIENMKALETTNPENLYMINMDIIKVTKG